MTVSYTNTNRMEYAPSWTNINLRFPQRSVLGPLIFLFYINNLSDKLSTNMKLFTNDTSFVLVFDPNQLRNDSKK